jgi:hypothetical protein
VTAELNNERQKSREREHECHVLKDEIQVTFFVITLDVGPGIQALQSFVVDEVEHNPGLRYRCSLRLCQERPSSSRKLLDEKSLSFIIFYFAQV